MAIGSLAIAALTAAVSCNAVLRESSVGQEQPAALIGASEWQVPFCQQHANDFDEVEFEVITQQKTRNIEQQKTARGSLHIGPVRAGRAQLKWQSADSPDHVTVWLKVTAKRNSWTVNKSIPPGGSIEAVDVQQVVANVAPLMGIKVISAESPVGKVAAKQMRAGDIVTADSVTEPPLVKRNDRVQVIVRSGALQITSPGQALATGWKVGDLIPVTVENAEGPTEAKVIGKGNVAIQI